jgi:hypothetical protein
MTTSKRAALAAVLLLTFTLAASLQAHATLETFTFTMNWTDGHTVFPTTGFFEFNTYTNYLGNYSITAPGPIGTLTNANSTAQLFVNGGPCLSIDPCFRADCKGTRRKQFVRQAGTGVCRQFIQRRRDGDTSDPGSGRACGL